MAIFAGKDFLLLKKISHVRQNWVTGGVAKLFIHQNASYSERRRFPYSPRLFAANTEIAARNSRNSIQPGYTPGIELCRYGTQKQRHAQLRDAAILVSAAPTVNMAGVGDTAKKVTDLFSTQKWRQPKMGVHTWQGI
jgi:hypothetical protein